MSNVNIYRDKEEYLKSFSQIDENTKSLPVYLSEKRKQLQGVIEKSDQYYGDDIVPIYKADYGLILSKDLSLFQKYPGFAKKWIESGEYVRKITVGSTLTVIGYYRDFNQKSILNILEMAFKKNVKVFFLVARDLSSLSWLIAKQFLRVKWNHKGVFSHKKISDFSKLSSDWNLFDINKLESNNIKKELESKQWESLIFHGHGKEDHLNLADYTLSGINDDIEKSTEFAPSIGHEGQSYFKEISKAIPVDQLRVSKLYLLSCNNLPFNDSRLYDSKYNIVLQAIDGYTQNIVASLSVQSADSPELNLILEHAGESDIVQQLEEKLYDIQLFPSLIEIGLPQTSIAVNNLSENIEINHSAVRLTHNTRIILSRVSSYTGSMMVKKDHEINRLSQKIWGDYVQNTRRGTFIINEADALKFEKDLINRVNPFSKRIAEIMLNDPYDDLQEFDNFNIYRSVADRSTLERGTCVCGGDTFSNKYIPEVSCLFPLESTYCYRCGDKYTKMMGMPEIIFSSDEVNKDSMKIHYKIEITPKQTGDVYFGIQLPSYVQQSVENIDQLHKIRFKNIRTDIIEGVVEFKKDVVLQSYYMKLIAVQNGGISFSRSFFNLI